MNSQRIEKSAVDGITGADQRMPEVWIEADCPRAEGLRVCRRQRVVRPVFVIGRRRSYIDTPEAREVDLQIPDQQPFSVSRRHCAIELADSKVVVRDLGSRFGTLVDGVRLGEARGRVEVSLPLSRGVHRIVLGPNAAGLCLRLTIA